jgi:hypothetical protein
MLEAEVRVNTAKKHYQKSLDSGLPPAVSRLIPDKKGLRSWGVRKKAGCGPGLEVRGVGAVYPLYLQIGF